MEDKFYVTTPIYYGNGLPHVGHFYSSIIANTLYKYHKISGIPSRFTTGIDENSQKAVIKAEEKGVPIMDYLDEMADEHKKVWDYFNFDYTDFIRTTEPRHHTLVQDVLQKCFDRGDIYEGEYEGMYCIGCEAFKKDDDLIEVKGKKVCPDHLKEPDKIKEKNYFFKLSRYQKWMEEFYKENPDFVNPDFRFNEVIEFTKRGLEDFSISRETNTFGIPLPFDNSQVTYVWFDALFNYYTSCKYSPLPNSLPGEEGTRTEIDGKIFHDETGFFPADVHVVGKDIIRFHAIFWPAMLASYFNLGEEKDDGILHYKKSDREFLPKQILTSGFFTVDGQKISKTIGNVIEPVEYTKKYGKELLTLYILSAFPIGNDGDFDRKDAVLTFNAKLANNFGNLVNRGVVLTLKTGVDELDSKVDISMQEKINSYFEKFERAMDSYNLKIALDETFKFLDEVNKYADAKEPWQMIKDYSVVKETQEVLYTILESVRLVGLALYPFFPEKMGELFQKIGVQNYTQELEDGGLKRLILKKEVFHIIEKGEPLFQRLDVE